MRMAKAAIPSRVPVGRRDSISRIVTSRATSISFLEMLWRFSIDVRFTAWRTPRGI